MQRKACIYSSTLKQTDQCWVSHPVIWLLDHTLFGLGPTQYRCDPSSIQNLQQHFVSLGYVLQ